MILQQLMAILAESSIEDEIIPLATSIKEASWRRNLFVEIPLWEKPIPAMLINCDNIATISKIENRFYNEYLDYKSSFDRVTYVNVEVKVASYEI
ncbi:hypothetical protein Lal_00011356 [Lupinus albus]|nr:hypothetical protein Lal_00011356 [Lupinus albus]